MSYYQKQLFFCVNQKEPGKQCCADADALPLKQFAKQYLKKKGLHGPGQYRVTQSGCLGRCKMGPCLVIYPEGVWYTFKDEADVQEIIDEHLIKNGVVSRLLLDP